MKATDLPPVWRRALAAHAAFGRLGFDPGELFMHFQPVTYAGLHVLVRLVQGVLDLDVDCGAVPGAAEHELKAQWSTAVRAWNATDQDARDHVFKETYSATMFALLGAALAAKGIQPPAVPVQRLN